MESGNIPEGVLDGEFCLRAIRLSLPCTGTYYTRHQASRAQRHFELSKWPLPRFRTIVHDSASSTEPGGFALPAGDASVDSWFREIYVLRAWRVYLLDKGIDSSSSSRNEYKELKRRTSYTIKAGVNVKAVFTSLNTAFLPISRSRFKRRQIPMLITLSTIWQFCVNFWVIFRCFGKERFFLKG